MLRARPNTFVTAHVEHSNTVIPNFREGFYVAEDTNEAYLSEILYEIGEYAIPAVELREKTIYKDLINTALGH